MHLLFVGGPVHLQFIECAGIEPVLVTHNGVEHVYEPRTIPMPTGGVFLCMNHDGPLGTPKDHRS